MRGGALAADALREAALRGDSPLLALAARARASDSESSERPLTAVPLLTAMAKTTAPTIELPAQRPGVRIEPASTPPVDLDADTAMLIGGLGRDDSTAIVRLNRLLVDEPNLPRVLEAMVATAVKRRGGAKPTLSAPARAALEQRSFPGNARELNAILAAGAMVADGRPIHVEDLPLQRRVARPSRREALRDFERRFIEGCTPAAAT